MKNLFRFTLLALGVAVATTPLLRAADDTSAPPAAHPGMRRMVIRNRLAKQLNLTDDQKAQLKAKRAATADTLKAIRADTSLTKDQKKAKVRDTLAAERSDMRSVLTPDQQTQFDQLRANAKPRHRGNVNN